MVAGGLQEPQPLRETLDDGDDRDAQDREREQHLQEGEPRALRRAAADETRAHSRWFLTRPVTASTVTR